jgi:hypothetical protein
MVMQRYIIIENYQQNFNNFVVNITKQSLSHSPPLQGEWAGGEVFKYKPMIQRIQTLYLALAAIGCILLIFFPLAQYDRGIQGIYALFVYGLKYTGGASTLVQPLVTSPLLILLAVTFVLIVVSIFLFKKRRIQVLLINTGFLLQVIFISLVFLFYTGYFEKFLQTKVTYQPGIFIPMVILVFLILASRAVRKDEALVRSTSRLR